jgi:alkylation response protein AidB-like acyl-CoA dehydrogenase
MTAPTLAPFAEPVVADLRAELRAWFVRELPTGWGTAAYNAPNDEDAELVFLRAWQRKLYDAGWAGITWPTEYGGRGASLLHQAVFVEERDRAKAPLDVGIVGTQMVGPMLIRHGSPEQKERYLRRILTGEDLWCQGFSEPGSGSDLASLRTRAVPAGDDGWLLSGQKVWTSRAHQADLMILLARTESVPGAPHRGISAFVVPMDTPGLTVRAIRQVNGSHDFCEVFLDDAFVPADAVVGDVGRGWTIAISTLSFERFATTRAFEMRNLVTELEGYLDGRAGDELARHICDAHAAGLSYQRMVARMAVRGEIGVDASVGKLFSTELGQRIVATAMATGGDDVVSAPVTTWRGGELSWSLEFVNSLKNTIAAGTSQIQRNIIGERVLGLPREEGPRS